MGHEKMGTDERDNERFIEKCILKKPSYEEYPCAFKVLRVKNIACLMASVMLFLATATTFNLPYVYYILLRWFIAAVALFVGLIAWCAGRWAWAVIMCTTLIVYNPVDPIYLYKEAWVVIDLISITLFITAIFDVNPRSESDYRALDYPCSELLMSKAERERITREHLEHELKDLEKLEELRKQPAFKNIISEKDIEELRKKLGYKISDFNDEKPTINDMSNKIHASKIEGFESNHEKEKSSEIECIYCKKKFIPWRKNQKFCSVSCRQKYYQNR